MSEAIFDLKMMKEILEKEVPEYDKEIGEWTVRTYIGTVMGLLPSGKYYTVFACSNVEVCDACKKASEVPCNTDKPCIRPDDNEDDTEEEYHCEACKDAKWHEQAENELESIGAYLTCSEGCATDLIVEMIMEKEDE